MQTGPGDDDAALIDAFRAGDQDALDRIYVRWSPLVYSLALARLDSVTAAEGVTQRVFTQAWTDREAFQQNGHRLSTWLIEITQRTLADRARAAEADRSQEPPTGTDSGIRRFAGPADGIDGEVDSANLVERLELADEISRLDDQAQQILRLALFDNLTHDEIAERTHLSADAVQKQIRHSLTKLRERLEVETDAH